jgi:hypothetical protein
MVFYNDFFLNWSQFGHNFSTDYQHPWISSADRQGQLPAGYLPYQEHKKREKIRREWQAEIQHVKAI